MSGLYAIDVTTFEDAGRFGRCMRRIPSERRERIARLRLPEDRRRSLGAGWLLAEVLLRYFGLEMCIRDSSQAASTRSPFRSREQTWPSIERPSNSPELSAAVSSSSTGAAV